LIGHPLREMVQMRSLFLLALGVLLIAIGTYSKDFPLRNDNPVIGIVSLPASQCINGKIGGYCIPANYVGWLKASGAQIVPIKYDAPAAEIRKLQKQLNGILFTGGGLDLFLNSSYMKTSKLIFDLATSNADDYFPLWGTCMGFQNLHILAAWDEKVLCEFCYDSTNVSWSLDMNSKAKSSRFLGSLPPVAFLTLASKNVTYNWHHDGIEPRAYQQFPKLAEFYDVLSTNVDKKGKTFLSTIEAKKWPIYGIQWHAERVQFQFESHHLINHSPESIFVVQSVSNFFINEARKSSHVFASDDVLQKALIDNIVPVNQQYGELVYIF